MTDYQVTCVRRTSEDGDRRFDLLGGPGWFDTIDHVIRCLQGGEHRFWTSLSGRRQFIEVQTDPQSDRLHLAVEGDVFPANRLLDLPACS